MSAASRKNDPFNFDEIYKQAGVEDLFVKKTMAEQKQKPAPGPIPSASPVRPPVITSASKPAPNVANFDLDFLAAIATPGGTPPSMSKQNSSTSLTAASVGQQQQPPKQVPPSFAASRTALDDPFALFEELPGAAVPQKHAPPPALHPPAGSGGLLLDLDDGRAFTAPPAPPAPSSGPLRPSAPPSASAEAAQLRALPAQLPSQQPPSASQPSQPPPPGYTDHSAHRTEPAGHPAATRPLSSGATSVASSAPGSREFSGTAGSIPSSSGADYHPHPSPVPHAPARPPHQYHQGPAPGAAAFHHMDEGPESSEPSNSSSPTFTWGHAPSGSGISGYLKAFGKKAVRVAKAGLAQLEHALEGLDQPHQGHANPRTPTSSVAAGQFRSDTDGAAEVSNDEALAWAVRLSDLPPHAQQHELAHMAPPLRRKVVDVLRAQIRSEHEAAAVASAPPSGTGFGHGVSEPSRTAPPPPPPYGHGSPLPAQRPSTQDGSALGQQHSGLGVPRDHVGHEPDSGSGGVTAVAAPPPAYVDIAQHPAAMARQAPPPQPPAPAADLLGLGGGEAPPQANPFDVPVPMAATAAAAAPVVDDLLGFGDSALPARAAPPGARTAPPPSAKPMVASVSGPAAPPAAAPVAAPAPAVHVDDIDEFFSGGKTTATGRSVGRGSGPGSGPAVHASSSAPNLGAPQCATATADSSGNAAALADMLHSSDDEGGGADVDVSGYADLYKGEQGTADEPELRRRLRAQREAAKHAKMKAALAEKLAMEAEEAARREQQVALKDQYKADIETWKSKNKGNIRGLLGSLHTVLWPDSGWAPVSVGDLLEPGQVKRVYMRANLLVHPDKVRQRNGSPEQVAIADMVFDVLKEAWNVFR